MGLFLSSTITKIEQIKKILQHLENCWIQVLANKGYCSFLSTFWCLQMFMLNIFSVSVTSQSKWTECSPSDLLSQRADTQTEYSFLDDLLTPKVIPHEFTDVRSVSTGVCAGCCNALSVSSFRMEGLFPHLPREFPANVSKLNPSPGAVLGQRGADLYQLMAPLGAVHIQFLVHVWIKAPDLSLGLRGPLRDGCELCCGCVAVDLLLIIPAPFTLPQVLFLKAVAN